MRINNHAPRALWAFILAALIPFTLPPSAHADEGGYRLLKLNGYKVKWGEQRLGAGASISYAFANETMRFEGARNCAELVPMTALTGPGLSLTTLKQETAAAFAVWERAANLSFHPVADAHEADIVLGAQGRPVGQAFANVTYLPGAKKGVRSIGQGLVCLNPERQWKVGFDGDTDVYDIRYTLIHEIGHAVGLDHPGPQGQIMGFLYTEAFAGLQPGDVRGIQQLYGPSVNGGELAASDAYPQNVSTDDAVETATSLSVNEHRD